MGSFLCLLFDVNKPVEVYVYGLSGYRKLASITMSCNEYKDSHGYYDTTVAFEILRQLRPHNVAVFMADRNGQKSHLYMLRLVSHDDNNRNFADIILHERVYRNYVVVKTYLVISSVISQIFDIYERQQKQTQRQQSSQQQNEVSKK